MQTGKRYLQLLILVAASVLGLMATADRAVADDFFASSPGALTSSHSALDTQNNCNDCHINNTKELSNDKCLGCHDHQDLASRIAAGKGFHASGGVKGKKCETCHHEHKGKSYDVMGWSSVKGGQDGFDHQLSGWPLNGAHGKTPCADCHKTKNGHGLKTFMGTDRLCGTCHNKDQPHKFERKDMLACERCHTESLWKPQKKNLTFDHDNRKDAGMPILGAHKDVACTKCHPKAVFNLPFAKPDSCGNSGCHKSPHDGHLFGKRECEWCHSPTFKSLKNIQVFDHSERTKFDLGTSHKDLKCEKCHTKALGEGKPNAACELCHAKDNKHQQRFAAFGDPPKCQACHPSSTFKRATAFNHGKSAKFALTFAHAKATCRQCHRGSGVPNGDNFEKLGPSQQCMGCHEHKKVHVDDQNPKGKYKDSQCLQCHLHPGDITINTGPGNKMVDVAHGAKGTFPLVKGHKDVPCNECHKSRDKKNKTSFSELPSDCDAAGQCHEDTLHQGELGADCATCHTPGIWDALEFDHDKPFPKDAKGKVASYPLKGAHKDNKCEACHPQKKFAQANVGCSDEGCHEDDDAHKGRLGKACERCHLETGDNVFNHNTMSKFRLDGKHLVVRCADCHPSVTFKPRPQDCFGCHPEPQVHKGQYGTGCAQCHTTRTWEDVKPLHDVGYFSLKGAHNNIACERCHRDNRPLAGSGNLCLNCHKQDDIHSNSLSPKCGDCHTQWSFAPARFDHTRVGCNLTGLHRTLACFDCHKNGNFAAVSPNCIGCHRDDAVKAGQSGGIPHPAQATCAGCHNPNAWKPSAPFGRESV
ncbi:MAG: hypothetical protein NT062_29630, partial [Proteobacteria bacterium]|nr:hypothetical protein [Pseudomonadota bacterium]